MVISIVAAYAWGVLQLIVLGSFARTVRIRTVYAALAVGLYLCAPLTVVLQASWTGLVAPLLGMSAPELVRAASYTVDPFLEELMKMLPLALLMLVPTFRRQWSFTDFVLIGAATGAGFGLAEDLYRFGASADRAEGIAGGWALVFSQGYLFVPSIFKTLTSWLPVGVAGGTSDVARLNVHLVWSSVVGLAVGLTVLSRTKASRLTALGLLVCISLDHAAGNMSDVGNSWLFFLSWPLAALVHLRGLMPIAALAVALWLDQRRQGVRDSVDLLLQAERSAPSRLKGTLVAAFSRPPWSLIAVDRFVRMRRAVLTERTAATAQADTLGALVMTERDRVDRELAQWQTDVPALFPPGWTLSSLGVALRRPAVILWLVILTPSVLWFVIGGWPQTAGLQVFMKQPAVWMVLFPVSVLAQAWIAWRTIAGLRSWSLARDASVGDDAATVGLRVACGIGAVSLGAFSLLRMLGGITPGSSIFASLHAQDAANNLTPAGGSMLAGSAGAFAPPPPTLELPDTAGASAGSSSGASSGTSNSNADSGRTSTPPPTNKAPPPAPLPPDEAAAARARAAAADALAAQEQARAAHDAADAADIAAADDFNDPWGDKSPRIAAADAARDASRAADAARNDAMDAARQSQADADAQAEAARTAADQRAAAQHRAADPEGVAADEAAKAAGVAEQRANQTFMEIDKYDSSGQPDPSGAQRRHEADQAAILARQQADAARAAADAAKAARETYAAQGPSAGWKPDKP